MLTLMLSDIETDDHERIWQMGLDDIVTPADRRPATERDRFGRIIRRRPTDLERVMRRAWGRYA